ncbi:hypothetical protein MTP99_018206 [Tenebrio molitor]|jgi:low density lipoprotein receptor adapter protein 1|uniref:low density lipoprotein receptor adapter protein 1-like n=1 Tax=Tenebrio molitor TaxID=7067 RepID=UPI0027021ACD|nr:hypothetical protein MTP99_018206 [Tenebrio molitor]
MAFLKSIWKTNGKHHKLSEELALQNAKEAESEQMEMIENENDVITFKLKYLGSTVVEKMTGDNISTEAVKNIIKVTKAGRKKLQRVHIAISLKGIVVTDLEGNDILKISIYRISNCSTDPTHRQVFSFVSTDSHETMECHAFICPKRKMAETVTLAVAHAFGTAYEAWRIMPSTKEFTSKENERNNINQKEEGKKSAESDIVEEKLIDFDDEPDTENQSFDFGRPPCQENSHWVCFDDDFKTDLIMA